MSSKDFERGYLIATSNMLSMFGDDFQASHVLNQLGVTRARMIALGLDDGDCQRLHAAFDHLERKARP